MLDKPQIPELISSNNPHYISLRHTAELMAAENPETSVADHIETLKYALFNSEFEPEKTPVPGTVRDDPRNWPQSLIEIPLAISKVSRETPKANRPKTHYSYRLPSLIDYFDFYKMLPEAVESNEAYTKRILNSEEAQKKRWIECAPLEPWQIKTAENLAYIPFRTYPQELQDFLLEIKIAKEKLIIWMEQKKHPLPKFLRSYQEKFIKPDASKATSSLAMSSDTAINTSEHPANEITGGKGNNRGRRPKNKQLISQIVRRLHAENPGLKQETLATDAIKIAKNEFHEKNPPSIKTIIGWMKSILEQRD